MDISKYKKLPLKRIVLTAVFSVAAISGMIILYRFYPIARKWFPKCPSYEFFGLYCSGCGNTRALYYFLHGEFCSGFRNNIMLLPTLILAFALCWKPKNVSWSWIINIYLAVSILYTILRNLPWYPFTLLAPVPFPS